MVVCIAGPRKQAWLAWLIQFVHSSTTLDPSNRYPAVLEEFFFPSATLHLPAHHVHAVLCHVVFQVSIATRVLRRDIALCGTLSIGTLTLADEVCAGLTPPGDSLPQGETCMV
ncbi:unnamed protein product [Clonostachys rosea]|uniref:Secreted protein n=1 Tax=Bionectria ochroleuca TaxID=29856 RepID=A0ABY6TN91_BIOOC|nr:unnamed protein product [Clonostachys rosea]